MEPLISIMLSSHARSLWGIISNNTLMSFGTSTSKVNRLQFIRSHGCIMYSTNKDTSSQSSSSMYCVDLVRKYDYENYLCTLLLPNETRTTAFAIRAFNIEVARVEEIVSNVTIGQMRLKFWDDLIENIYENNVPKHPVAVQLSRALHRRKMSKRYFKRLISTRRDRLLFPTLDSMEVYAENSASSIFYLLLEASGVTSVQCDHAASHLGKALGLCTLLRALPHHAQHGRVVLPADVLATCQVADETVLRGSRDQPIRDVVFQVANRAKKHLDQARMLSPNVPAETRSLYLPAINVANFLDKLSKRDFDIFDHSLMLRSAFLPVKLYWNKALSNY